MKTTKLESGYSTLYNKMAASTVRTVSLKKKIINHFVTKYLQSYNYLFSMKFGCYNCTEFIMHHLTIYCLIDGISSSSIMDSWFIVATCIVYVRSHDINM